MPFRGKGGVSTLSGLEIDTDKDWKAHGIYNLGDLTPKVDGAYNLGGPNARFDTAYAHSVPGVGSLIKKTESGVADTIYGAASDSVPAAYFQNTWTAGFTADIAYQTELQPVKAASVFNHSNLTVSRAADITYQSELQPVKAASIFDHANLDVPRVADIAYQSELMPVKFADIFDHGNLSSGKAKDIIYHANFNLPSAEARDKVAESVYGMASDLVGVKGISKQITEKRDFAFRTETPDHSYWHRMYNTPAAFETVYQDYTTSMQKRGTTPSKSAPGTADPNPQPGAVWSVSMLPDGTQVGGFASPEPDPRGLSWDGTYLWHAGRSAGYIYQLKTDGTQVGGFVSPGPDARGVEWDGEYLWHSDSNANYIYQLKTDGTPTGNGFASPGPEPCGLSWDGTYLWNGDIVADYIYQVDPATGTATGNGFASATSTPSGIAWDGTYLWESPRVNYVYQYKPDGTQVGGFVPPGPSPFGAAWDGAYLWNADGTALYIYQLGNAGNFDVNYRIFAK